jgi:hypothetical protein
MVTYIRHSLADYIEHHARHWARSRTGGFMLNHLEADADSGNEFNRYRSNAVRSLVYG